MLLKIVLTLSVVAVVTYASPLASSSYERAQYNMTVVSVIDLEEPCVRQGGMCLRIEDCDPSNLVRVQAVLCPRQRHLGVECCYN